MELSTMRAKSVNTDNISTGRKDLFNNKSVLFVVILLTSAVMTLWTFPEFSYLQRSGEKLTVSSKIISKINKYHGNKYIKTKTDLKYILFWTPRDWYPFVEYRIEQKAFFEYKCKVTNCYVTDNRSYFGGDLKKFDALLFNGRNLHEYGRNMLPLQRYPHQKYVFNNKEPADQHPMCNEILDNYFNWTSTYKLDSTMDYGYIRIRDTNGTLVGPKTNMTWVKDMKDVNDSFAKSLETKKKAAAWFVSHCSTRSKREDYIKLLQKELNKYNLKVDVYGKCGNLTCGNSKQCDEMLRKDYFFYLAFENSISEDYATEKILHGLKYNTVPVVYGGANYSRFLPPGSYLNARTQTPEQLAAAMNSLIQSPKDYRQYFKWKSYYTYHDFDFSGICDLCSMLNDEKVFKKHTLVKQFRIWWHENFVKRCQ